MDPDEIAALARDLAQWTEVMKHVLDDNAVLTSFTLLCIAACMERSARALAEQGRLLAASHVTFAPRDLPPNVERLRPRQ